MKKVIKLTESDLTKIVKQVLVESEDFYSKLINILDKPYFQNLISIGIPEEQWETILSKLYNKPVTIDEIFKGFQIIYKGRQLYGESIGIRWVSYDYDDLDNVIFYENSDGEWEKSEYDDNGFEIYFENYRGYWYKREYDEYGNIIYYEDSDGDIEDYRNKIVIE
jgi:hypothetical protein